VNGDEAGKAVRHWHTANRLRADVISGRLAPGDKLDRETVLAARYGVARGTMRAAIELLREQGILVSRHGTGTFVAASPTINVILLNPGDSAMARLPDEREREERGLPPGVPVIEVNRCGGGTEYYDASLAQIGVPSPGGFRGGH